MELTKKYLFKLLCTFIYLWQYYGFTIFKGNYNFSQDKNMKMKLNQIMSEKFIPFVLEFPLAIR